MAKLNEVELARQQAEDELINPPKPEKTISFHDDDEYCEDVRHDTHPDDIPEPSQEVPS